jgi:hypothetical protein
VSYYQKKKHKEMLKRKIYDDMSAFEREKWSRRLDKFWKQWAYPVDYSSSPGKWNRLHSTVPARRKTKINLNKVLYNLNDDHLLWPDYKKPLIYYW